MKYFLASTFEIIEIVLIAVVTVFIVRTFILQPFLVNGASMEPNFENGDYLLVDELSYRLRAPERGEVIVFRYPGDESVFYIKRIIGLPGEKLEFSREGLKIQNDKNPHGFFIKEPYVPSPVNYADKEIVLKPTQYFVMGDNRPYSFDSRSWGPLDQKEIIGLVRLRLWPLGKVSLIKEPKY